MMTRTFLGLLFGTLIFASPLVAAKSESLELSELLSDGIAKLDREASMDAEGPMLLAYMLEVEFGTREEELMWGVDQKMSWGEIAALAYIQATTGKSFAEMNHEDARRDFWTYAENSGMSREKMAHWLEGFQKRA